MKYELDVKRTAVVTHRYTVDAKTPEKAEAKLKRLLANGDGWEWGNEEYLGCEFSDDSIEDIEVK